MIDLDAIEERATRQRTQGFARTAASLATAVALVVGLPVAVALVMWLAGPAAFWMLPILLVPAIAFLVVQSVVTWRASVEAGWLGLVATVGEEVATDAIDTGRRVGVGIGLALLASVCTMLLGVTLQLDSEAITSAAWAVGLACWLLTLLVARRARLPAHRQRATTQLVLMVASLAAIGLLMAYGGELQTPLVLLFAVVLWLPVGLVQLAIRRERWALAQRLLPWVPAPRRWRDHADLLARQEDWAGLARVVDEELHTSVLPAFFPALLHRRAWAVHHAGDVAAARQAWVVALHSNAHDATARTMLAWLDLREGGPASAGTFQLLDTAAQHQGRLRPAQYEDVSALTWAALALAYRRAGAPKQELEARDQAERELDGAPAHVAVCAREALALLD